MASKRKLKKEVVKLAGLLYEEAVLLRMLSTKESISKLDDLIDQIIVFTDDTIRRVQNPDGKDNPMLIKQYYRKLREDIKAKEQEYNTTITALITGV